MCVRERETETERENIHIMDFKFEVSYFDHLFHVNSFRTTPGMTCKYIELTELNAENRLSLMVVLCTDIFS